MIKVLEVDQWSSTGDIEGTNISEWEEDPRTRLYQVLGGDSEAARVIFGGHAIVVLVNENKKPNIGNVWFKPDDNGDLVQWKTNYDSSD